MEIWNGRLLDQMRGGAFFFRVNPGAVIIMFPGAGRRGGGEAEELGGRGGGVAHLSLNIRKGPPLCFTVLSE